MKWVLGQLHCQINLWYLNDILTSTICKQFFSDSERPSWSWNPRNVTFSRDRWPSWRDCHKPGKVTEDYRLLSSTRCARSQECTGTLQLLLEIHPSLQLECKIFYHMDRERQILFYFGKEYQLAFDLAVTRTRSCLVTSPNRRPIHPGHRCQ